MNAPRIRPSSLPALAQCPRYVPDQTTDVAQKDAGTDRHKALSAVLAAESEQAERAILDALPEDDREGVEWAAEYIRVHAPMSDHPLQCEQKRTFLDAEFDYVEGTPDVVCGDVIFDLKWRDDVCDYRAQMAAYALMLQHEDVTVHILYALHQRAEVIRFHVSEAVEIVLPTITRAKDPNYGPRACSFCGWCANRLTCPAVVKEVNDIDPASDPKQTTDAAALGEMLRRARIVKEWCESFEAHAKEMAFKKGVVPAGFRPVTQKGRRQIQSVTDAFSVLRLPQEEFLAACSVSFSDLVEVWQKFHGLSKAASERDVESRLGDVMTRGGTINMLKE